jgi:hypothetical protein
MDDASSPCRPAARSNSSSLELHEAVKLLLEEQKP